MIDTRLNSVPWIKLPTATQIDTSLFLFRKIFSFLSINYLYEIIKCPFNIFSTLLVHIFITFLSFFQTKKKKCREKCNGLFVCIKTICTLNILGTRKFLK